MKSTKISHHNNFVTNIPFLISGCGFAALQVTSFKRLLAAMLMVIVLLIASMYLKDVASFRKQNASRLSHILTVCLLALSALTFYSTMINSSKLKALASLIGIPSNAFVFFITLAGSIAAFYFVNTACSFVLLYLCFPDSVSVQDTSFTANSHTSALHIIVIVITAIVTITICSKSSPLYPFNDWVDANCFMTVGKSMLYGKVPYRDLYEQKGPLLYMFHALAALVSETSFLGVYFLEIIACAFYLFYGYKTMQLYRKSTSIFLIPILSAVVYSASCFCHGDSAEELCLPLIAYAVYVGLKGIQRKDLPTQAECLMVGVTSACVLWIKFSMLGFYLGWICVPAVLLLRSGNITKVFQKLLFIFIGILIPTLPILWYFAANQALPDLWTVYFYNNLFFYTSSTESTSTFSAIYNLLAGVKNILNYNILPAMLAGIGGLCLLKKKEKTDFLFILTSAIGLFLLVYVGGRRYQYYSLIFSVFAPTGIIAIAESVNCCFKNRSVSNVIRRFRKHYNSIICLASFIFAFVMCENTYLLQYKKSELPQYQFAEIISQIDDATLLNYGFLDGGFYTTTGIIPNCKYFCDLNIGLPEIMETQDIFVSQGMVDFVVTRDSELDSELYECVATTTFYFEGANKDYYLYQIIEE